MKSFANLLLIIGLTAISYAQQPAVQTPVDLIVLKCNWTKEREFLPIDPERTSAEGFEEMRRRVNNEMIDNAIRNTPGGKPISPSGARSTPVKPLSVGAPPRTGYRYRASVQNTGASVIKAVMWEYVFTDPETQQVVGRHEFISKVKISPGKIKELTVFSPQPPTKMANVISAEDLKRPVNKSYREQVVLIRIQYADGSVWERP